MDCLPNCVSVECVIESYAAGFTTNSTAKHTVTDTGFWLSLNKIIHLILTCTVFPGALSMQALTPSPGLYSRPYSGTQKTLLYNVVEYGNVGKFVRLNSVNVNVGPLWFVQVFIYMFSRPSSCLVPSLPACRYASPRMKLLSLLFSSCRFSYFPLFSSNRQFKLPERLIPPFSDAWVGSSEESQFSMLIHPDAHSFNKQHPKRMQ